MHVYVIAASAEGPSKIGLAADPRKRLKDLQTANACHLRLHASEPIGIAAEAVERAVHRIMRRRRCPGGSEWFDVTPDEAHAAIRRAAAAAGALLDERATFHDVHWRETKRWLEQWPDNYEDEEEFAAAIAATEPISPATLVALSLDPPASARLGFNDYLLTWTDGMWLRWSFERMGQRLPAGRKLEPYLDADDLLDERNIRDGRDIADRWIEWSVGRDLRRDEVRALVGVWDQFAPIYARIERDGPQWATAGIDDQVDDVRLLALSGDRVRGEGDYAVFIHPHFRAVLVPRRPLDLFPESRALRTLAGEALEGFVAPWMPVDIWMRPFLPWIDQAPGRRDASLACFLANPAKRFPKQRPYDGSRRTASVWAGLPSIDEAGEASYFSAVFHPLSATRRRGRRSAVPRPADQRIARPRVL
jgi:hypothetical protein